jgi:hypothetical protein
MINGQRRMDCEHYNYKFKFFKTPYYKRSSNSIFLLSCLEDRLETIILRIAAPSICLKMSITYKLRKKRHLLELHPHCCQQLNLAISQSRESEECAAPGVVAGGYLAKDTAAHRFRKRLKPLE